MEKNNLFDNVKLSLENLWGGVKTWYTDPGSVVVNTSAQIETNKAIGGAVKSVTSGFYNALLIYGIIAILGFYAYQFALRKGDLK
jgi:hypothetical protein